MTLPRPAAFHRLVRTHGPGRATLAALLADAIAACAGSGPMTPGGAKDDLLASGR